MFFGKAKITFAIITLKNFPKTSENFGEGGGAIEVQN
jgi:hypothetical protein